MTKILLLSEVEKLWVFLGFNLEKTTWFMSFYTALAFILVLVVPILGLMKLILEEFSLSILADIFESCGPNYQLLCKIMITRYKIKSIRYLLTQMADTFWPTDKFGSEVEKKQIQMYNVIKYYFKIYCCIICCCGITVCSRPLFLEQRRYPLATYDVVDVANTYFYVFLYSLHVYDFAYGVPLFLAVDGLYAVFVFNVLCQVTMLKHGFESLKINELKTKAEEKACYERLKEYVDHHNNVLEFIREMNDLYSVQLFNQFLGNTASLCMGIYIISAAIPDISTCIRAGLITATFITELIICCVGGTLITNACLQITESMYYSGWEENVNKRFRIACYMVLMNSQKEQKLKAGGLINVDVISLKSVLQTSFSFYTLMVKAKNGK